MLKKIKKYLNKLNYLDTIDSKFDQLKFNTGVIAWELKKKLTSKEIQDYEFKVFSQWNDDGIIQKLINSIEINNKTFIEFGVENFSESNCRFLMMYNNWSGFIIDGCVDNVDTIKKSDYYWKYDLTAFSAFITKNNINKVLLESGFNKDLGLLSIDIDGNDYHVLEAINFYSPRILICEFNAVFGSRPITVPYDESFVRNKAHYSNLYFGASITAIIQLARTKGYVFVGTNSHCNNAYFVKSELMNGSLLELDSKNFIYDSKFRESRNNSGELSFLSGNSRINEIRGLKVYNVEKNEDEVF